MGIAAPSQSFPKGEITTTFLLQQKITDIPVFLRSSATVRLENCRISDSLIHSQGPRDVPELPEGLLSPANAVQPEGVHCGGFRIA
jgi:hypothetical protein